MRPWTVPGSLEAPTMAAPMPDEPPRAPTWGPLLVGAGWIIVGALGVVALMRLVAWDYVLPFAILDAFTLMLFLPAWVVLAVAAACRRWWLAGAAALIAVAHLVFIVPEFAAATPVSNEAQMAPKLRLFDANVDQHNPDMTGFARQIRSFRPDVVVLEEANAADSQQIQALGALAGLTFTFQADDFGSRALFIASRFPLGPVDQARVNGLPYLTRTTLILPNRTVAFWAVHTTAPVPPDPLDWSRELAGINVSLGRPRHGPLIMVGDFNATWGNRQFRSLLDMGLTDAGAARGQALTMTWSQLTPFPPLVRIDHILTSPGVIATEVHTSEGPGSDHRDLTATIAILPGTPRST